MNDHREASPRNHKAKSYSRSPSRTRKVYREGERDRERRRDREDRRSRSHSRDRRYKSSRYSRSRSRSYGRGRSHSRSPMSSRRRHTGTRDNPKPSRCLGIFGLSLYTTEDELYHLMSKYGPLERCQVVIDAKTGRSRGFAFVYFESTEDAKVAKEQCSGMKINGKNIRVDYSITERAHTPTPGIYMGKPTYKFSDRYDRRRDRDSDYYSGGRSSRYRRSPSPYYSGSRRSRRYERSRSRSYSPRIGGELASGSGNEIPKNLPTTTEVPCDESWDDDNFSTYDPQASIAGRDIIKNPLVKASKSQKKEFRLAERQRHEALRSS